MAVAAVLLSLLSLLLSVAAAGDGKDSGELWCVAKKNADDAALQAALDWACGLGGADCGPIQQGGPCYSPSDLQTLASYALNDYFVNHGFDLAACDFSGTAAPISLNPSHDKCIFPSSSSARNGNFRGASVGFSTGLGPAGAADMNGVATSQSKTWLSALYFSVMILVAFGDSFR